MQIFTLFTSKEDGNLAYHVQDDEKNVKTNRERLAIKYGFDNKKLIFMNQVHKDNIVIVDKNSKNLIDACDAIITKEKNLPLMVMVADCIPILMYDEKKEVIAAIHAGRNSTFLNIAQKTALKMIKEFKCKEEHIKVILGPSIQKCCYEVSQELANIVKKSFGNEFENNRYIDLQAINKKQLNDIGITNIEISTYCTKCSGDKYYSYRKSTNTGRFAGVIMLKV
ncbi:peptidoglycan editing factor PgeF [Malaciobacter mytili]|uniref:peptidoglycan editing factor PgeF n=1 Tax=Malaciobacter mytili TaxID=603050 RepID=UPI00100BDD64|nr:peptidoglycan editing factor PgeF [Malaciobacter mytili]RXI44358.1 multicopper polyphenol oxidase [Malaciobacter mytili]